MDIISLSLYIGAAGTIAAIIVSVMLFSVNWQLARLQHPRVIMRLSEPEGRRTDQSPNGAVIFTVQNKSVHDTHILHAYIQPPGTTRVQDQVKLKFWWHKPDYVGHAYGNEAVFIYAPFHFVAETLRGGQVWKVEARPKDDVSIERYEGGRLVVEPVIGKKRSVKIPKLNNDSAGSDTNTSTP